MTDDQKLPTGLDLAAGVGGAPAVAPVQAKRPGQMTRDELMALREVERFAPETQRATWFEGDDPMSFIGPDGIEWTLHKSADGEWVRCVAPGQFPPRLGPGGRSILAVMRAMSEPRPAPVFVDPSMT